MNTHSRPLIEELSSDIIDHSNIITNLIKENKTMPTQQQLDYCNKYYFKKLLDEYDIPLNISSYGTIDKVIQKCLTILTPDVEYLLSIGETSVRIDSWLKDYQNYMNTSIQCIFTRVLSEQKKLEFYVNNIEQSKKLKMEKIKEFPSDVIKRIYEYIPHSIKVSAHLKLEEEQKKHLMRMKSNELRTFAESVYRHYVVLPRTRSDRQEIRNLFYSMNFNLYSGLRKIDIVNLIFRFIRKTKNIKTKDVESRLFFHNLSYRLCKLMILKCKVIDNKEEMERQQKHIKQELESLEKRLLKTLRKIKISEGNDNQL